MKKQLLFVVVGMFILFTTDLFAQKIYDITSFGLEPGSKQDASLIIQKAIVKIKAEYKDGDSVVLRFPNGKYNFYPKNASVREYYISNHDQTENKRVGIALEDLKNFALDGEGSDFIFHGRMIPLSLLRSSNCTLKNFSIDFKNPQIAQVRIKENRGDKGLVFEVAPWVNYRINKDTMFESYGDGWVVRQRSGIAFEDSTKRVVYRTSDLSFSTKGVREIVPRLLHAPLWQDDRLIPGTVVAMRSGPRPAPGIFMSHNTNTSIYDVKVHYAEGMGLLAQRCDNIKLVGFEVSLRGSDDPRYFTAQADATHFSGCKGVITSCLGLYENMMDDAINVHGTYLKVIKRVDDRTIIGRYMHSQSWGFEWGSIGDEVQFVQSNTMELVGDNNKISSIIPHDKSLITGAREFSIVFEKPIHESINEKEGFGVENLTWTPEVIFQGNTVRNNRARGALFSTPKFVVVEENLFDHTSGTAILLCGDCNGWYETGACRNVRIRGNHFVNALTSQFQFTNAIISIYPEIPNLEAQKKYFHGGEKESIQIIGNIFDTFDVPLLYAKSVDGLLFIDNKLIKNRDYKPYHPNKNTFWLERVTNAQISTPITTER